MRNFAWIIPIDKQGFLGNKGVSTSYIIPRRDLNQLESELTAGILWLIIRGQEDRCICALTIKRIERFSDGFNAGDFLIYPDLLKSIRLCSNYEDAKRYSLASPIDKIQGISEITDPIAESLKKNVSGSIEVKFTTPASLPILSNKVLSKNEDEKIFQAVSHIVESLNLNQMWGSGTGIKLNPIANFAAKALMIDNNHLLGPDLLNRLNLLNPIEAITSNETHNISKIFKIKRNKIVDISFTEIIPENIYARDFVAGYSTYVDLDAAMMKTDIAEKTHQLILRDISLYLKSIGVIPFESTSVDLMINRGGVMKIFEIKSTHHDNLIAQAAKGAFQIGAYSAALKEDFGHVNNALIINKITDKNLLDFVLKTLKVLNVNCLIYDSDANWPNRVVGLLN